MIALIIAAVILLIVIIYFFPVNNWEISHRKYAKDQEKNITSVYNTMWKVIKEKVSVSEKYCETFAKITNNNFNIIFKN